MPNPFESLWEDRPMAPLVVTATKKIAKPQWDFAEARKIYDTYLVRAAYLKKQQAYADKVAKATDGPSKTPVMPLATMGTNGGPLLCDHCHKPMILEGGKFNNIHADKAWEKNPDPKWVSYIHGGMVVEIVDNGTLRIYHGYPSQPEHCCNLALKKRQAEEAAFVQDRSKDKLIIAFLEQEFPDRVNELLTGIMNLIFKWSPGFGINLG